MWISCPISPKITTKAIETMFIPSVSMALIDEVPKA